MSRPRARRRRIPPGALALVLALAIGLPGHASPEDEAPRESWSILGFTRDGAHVFFRRERSTPDASCEEASLVLLRARDGSPVVSVPLYRVDTRRQGCFGDADAIPRERADGVRARLRELYGPVAAPVLRLAQRGAALVSDDLRVEVEVQTRLPASDCERIRPAMRARAYLRFRVERGGREEFIGRLAEVAPVPHPTRSECLAWPELALDAGAIDGDGRSLALVVGTLPQVLPLR